jgi:DNA topoisomerase-1
MDLLIVESPAKAKTINKYLGKGFQVLSSYGHVRGLPSEKGAVDPDQDFKMNFSVLDKAKEKVDAIIEKVKKADRIFLATDPDREGEGISWHLLEILKEGKVIESGKTVKRVTFNEITKKAVTEALKSPRDIDMDLVHAQQARQALDYLVGFTLSPVLWRKLPGSKSAGRVQSVALRLIVEREEEIDKFKIEEYWTIDAEFEKDKKQKFKATLTHIDKKRLDKFALANKEAADDVIAAISKLNYQVDNIEKKRVSRNPSPPFTTSTLIQEAARKLGFSAKKTSQVAQKLYEGISIKGDTVGLITYMRTDSVNLSPDAVIMIREKIEGGFGKEYLPASPRIYKTKAKNAQEAHEAIRPTNIDFEPKSIKAELSDEQYRLYDLIWKRTVACQMRSAELDVTSVDIASNDKYAIFRATGSVIVFDGFYKLYKEGVDDADDEESKILPPLSLEEALKLAVIKGNQHFTQPPPRFTEASLVKKLEELGIGRPSTYPTIISILQDRQYVIIDKKRFMPEVKGRVVTAFLKLYFAKYVSYDFTANMEEALDNVASGSKPWKLLLEEFWKDFKPKTVEVSKNQNQDITKEVEKALSYFLFKEDTEHKCPKCKDGELSLKLGSFGAFLGCSNYPECDYNRALVAVDNKDEAQSAEEAVDGFKLPKVVGSLNGEEVMMKKGPYGVYLQLGPDSLKRRSAIPSLWKPEQVDLKIAEFLLSLPKEVGLHPETGKVIKLSIGKFGPYLQHDGKFCSVRGINLMDVDLDKAVEIIRANADKKPSAKKVARGKKK